VLLRMVPPHWRIMMNLMNVAGGWTLPPEDVERVRKLQERQRDGD